VLCTDITYLYYSYGRKAYLSAIKDIATKEILGWQLSNNLTMKFVLDSVDSLEDNKTLSSKTIIHSDQGFHYTNPEYIKRVKNLNIKQSMSRKGNCIDNSPIETFFGHLKDDVDYKECKTFTDLNLLVKEYIDDGYSGARLDRPALDQFRKDLRTPYLILSISITQIV